MATNQTKPSWFTRYQRDPGNAPVRLFTFPFAGGGSVVYRDWGDKLKDVDVYCAALPGRERRIVEPPIGDLRLLIDKLLPALIPFADRPFILFGHSMGALIAYEVACRLREHGLTPQHLIVSAYRSPEQPRRNRTLHPLADDEFISELRRYGGSPETVLENTELMRLLLPMMRADFRLHETYEFTQRQPLDCPLTAITGTADGHVSEVEMTLWRDKTAGCFDLRQVEGKHFFVIDQVEAVLNIVRGCINQRKIGAPSIEALQTLAFASGR